MVKMNFTNNQTAFEYALYMIAASYFDKTVCKSERNERNMLLQYKEQKLNSQYQMEEICIKYMDSLVSRLPEKVFKQNMEVHLRKNKDTNLTEILFVNKNYIVIFCGKYAGKKSGISHKVWAKKKKKHSSKAACNLHAA